MTKSKLGLLALILAGLAVTASAKESAFITSGDNNVWTQSVFFGMDSVVDVDGEIPKKIINAEPGDIFEFAVLTNGSSLVGDLYKARSGTPAR